MSAISEAKSFDELGRVIVETCAKEFGAEVCTVWRRYTDDTGTARLRLLAASARAPQTLAQEITYAIRNEDPNGLKADGVTGYVAEMLREVHVSSLQQLKDQYGFCWKGYMDKEQWEGQPEQNFRSLSAFPLLLGNKLVGVLRLENKGGSTDGFPEVDRRALRELAPDIALVVLSFSLLETQEERLIQVPAKAVTALLRPFEPRELVSEIVKTVADSLRAEICSLWLVDHAKKELRLADGFGFSTETRAEQTYHLSEPSTPDKEIDGITAWVAVRKKPFWANSWAELKAHPSWKGKWDQPIWYDRGKDFRCLYAIPLLRQDSVIGVLKVENRVGAAFFTDSDRALSGIMASLITLVLDLGQQLRMSLISDLAHVIRSPIGQIPMNLSGLEREISKIQTGGNLRFDRVEGYINFIKKALLAVDVTSRTLTTFVQKPDDGVQGHASVNVSLVELVTERLDAIQPLLYDGITIKPDFSEDVQEVTVSLDVTDQTRVQIVIYNIIHNAIKYSKKGGVVDTRLSREGDHVVLSVRDSGQGISKDDLSRIFEPNFNRRALGHPQGTGIGLTTVKQILDRLVWAYDVSSRIDEGTTFRINIPTRKKV